MTRKVSNQPPKFEYQLAQFLFRACTKLGFCLPPKTKEALLKDPGSSLDGFIKQVMIAEGMPPSEYPKHFNSLKELLVEHLNADSFPTDFENHTD